MTVRRFNDSHLVIIAVPRSGVSAGVQRIVEDVVIGAMGGVMGCDDGVGYVGDLAPGIPRLPPLPAVVEDLQVFSPDNRQLLVIVSGSRIGNLYDLGVSGY